MRLPFLTLGGVDKFADYQAEFDKLLPSGLIDFLGNRVVFGRERCHHVCFKQTEKSQGLRNQWRQDRAERIPWIKGALERPTCISVQDGRTWVYLFQVEADNENSLKPERFCVIVDPRDTKSGTPGDVFFLTGYAISSREWDNFKMNKLWLYPPKQPKLPKKQK